MATESVPPSFFDLSFQAVSVVDGSWIALKQIPNYEKVAGELLYRKMFEIAPGIAKMFDFDEGTSNQSKQANGDTLVDIFRSPKFKKFIMGVLSMLDAALQMLGPDSGILTEMLTELGGRHVAYGVMPVHYGIFGRALLGTLQEMLGDAKWNKELNDGWSAIFGFISATMMVGASDKIEASKRRQRAAKKSARKSGKEVVPTKEVEMQRPVDGDIRRASVESNAAQNTARKEVVPTKKVEMQRPVPVESNAAQNTARKEVVPTKKAEMQRPVPVESNAAQNTVRKEVILTKKVEMQRPVDGGILRAPVQPNAAQNTARKSIKEVVRNKKVEMQHPVDGGILRAPVESNAAQNSASKSGKEVVPTKKVEMQRPVNGDILRAPVESNDGKNIDRKSGKEVVPTNEVEKRDQRAALKTARKSNKKVEIRRPFHSDILRAPVESDEPPQNIKFLVQRMFDTGSDSSDASSSSGTSVESGVSSFQESTAASSGYDTSMVSHVSQTWARVKKMPAYETIVGVLLFQKIFELKPKAIGPFESALGTSQDLYENPGFVAHVRGVIRMLDAVVNMLGPDLEPVTHTLERLGGRHVAYGLSTDYFEAVGEGLMGTLEVALGKHWTPEAKEGWIWIHTFLTASLVKGMNDQMQQRM